MNLKASLPGMSNVGMLHLGRRNAGSRRSSGSCEIQAVNTIGLLHSRTPCVDYGVVRMDPLHFLARCRKRQ